MNRSVDAISSFLDKDPENKERLPIAQVWRGGLQFHGWPTPCFLSSDSRDLVIFIFGNHEGVVLQSVVCPSPGETARLNLEIGIV